MEKLIKIKQSTLIKCDNHNCDYKIPYSKEKEKILFLFINTECPKCGNNLLTIEDYLTYKRLIRIINIINKWLSWITIFYSKKSKKKSIIIDLDKEKIKKFYDTENGCGIRNT